MAMEIFKLIGSVFVDTDKANESLSKTDKKAEGLGSKLAKGAGTAAKWGAGLATAAGAAGAAMVAAGKSTAASLDAIDKASQRMDMSAESYQKLAYAADLSGVSSDKLESAAKKLKKTYGADADLVKYLTDIAAIEDETERNTAAINAFGASIAQDLTPMLNAGADGIESMMSEAEQLGLVMSQDTVSSGAALNDMFSKVTQSVQALGMNLGAELMPIIMQLLEYIIEFMPTLQDMFSQFAPLLVGLMESLLPALMQIVSDILPFLIELITELTPTIIEIIEALLPIIIDLINMLLPPLMEIIKAILPVVITLLDAIMPILKVVLDVLTPILQLLLDLLAPIIKLIAEAIQPLITILAVLITEALKPLEKAFDVIMAAIGSYVKDMFENISAYIERIIGVFKGIAQFLKGVFSGDFREAFNGLKNIVKNSFGAIVELVKMPINNMIAMLNSFIDGINKIKVPDWVPAVGGKGINIPKIPKLYSGGVLEKGQMGLLEGTGAEAVVPLENNQKWIQAVSADMKANGIGGFDKAELMSAIIEALQTIMPELQQTVLVLPDENGIIRLVRKANAERVKTNGKALLN